MPTTYTEGADLIRKRFLTTWNDWIANGKPTDIRNPLSPREEPIQLLVSGTQESYIPVVYWENVENSKSNDHSRHWLRFSSRELSSGQSAFRSGCEGNRKAKYTTHGIIIIQLYLSRAAFAGDHRQLSVIARDIFRPRNLKDDPIWYRDSTIREIEPEERYFRANVNVNYQYDELI